MRAYDVAPDGKRFVMVKHDEDQQRARELVVVLDWFEEIKRLVPTDN